MIIQYMSFFVGLISRSIVTSMSICVVADGKIPLSLMAEYYSIVCTRLCVSHFLYSSVDGHLGCQSSLHIL